MEQTEKGIKKMLSDYSFPIETEVIRTLEFMREWFTSQQFIERYVMLTKSHYKTAQRKLRWLVEKGLLERRSVGNYRKRFVNDQEYLLK